MIVQRQTAQPYQMRQMITAIHPSITSAQRVQAPIDACQEQLALFNKVGYSEDSTLIRSLLATVTCNSETGDINNVNRQLLQEFLINFTNNIDHYFRIDICNIALKLLSNRNILFPNNLEYFNIIFTKLDEYCTKNIFMKDDEKAALFKLAPIIQSIYIICRNWAFQDTIALPLSSFLIRIYYQKACSGAIQNSAMSAICCIYMKQNEKIRKSIISEVVAEGKLLVGNPKQVLLAKSEKKNISAFSRICLEIVQSSCYNSDNYNISIDCAKHIISKIISGKSKNNNLLEIFSKDISTVLFHPLYPSAELFMDLIISILFVIMKENDQMSKVCINSLSHMVTAISKCIRESKEKKLIPVPYQLIKSLDVLLDDNFESRIYNNESNLFFDEESDTVSVIVCDSFPNGELELLIAQLIIVLYNVQLQQKSFESYTSLGFSISKFINEESDNASPMLKTNHELWKKGNIPFSVDFDWTLEIAYSLNISLAYNGTLIKNIGSIVLNMLKASKTCKASEKVIIFKEFSTIIDLFPSIMRSQKMISEMEQLMTNSYATVRESIIEVVSSYIRKTKDDDTKFMNIIIHALSDKSVTVVKCALNCLAEINSMANQDQLMELSTILASKLSSQQLQIKNAAMSIIVRLLLNDEVEAPNALNSIIGISTEIPSWAGQLFKSMYVKDISTSKRIFSNIISNYSSLKNANKIIYIMANALPKELCEHCKELLEIHNKKTCDKTGILSIAISKIINYLTSIPLKEVKDTFEISCNKISSGNVDVVRAEAQLASNLVKLLTPNEDKLEKMLNQLLVRIRKGTKEDKTIKRAIYISGCIYKFHGSSNAEYGKLLYQASMELFHKFNDDIAKSYILSAASDICYREKDLIESTSQMAKDSLESNSERQQVAALHFLLSLVEDDNDNISYSTFLIQKMLKNTIQCLESSSSKVRTHSLKLIKKCIEHGIVNPRQVLPNVIALLCADDQNEIAYSIIDSLIIPNEHSIVSMIGTSLEKGYEISNRYGNTKKYSLFSFFQDIKQTEKKEFIDEICNFFEESITQGKECRYVLFVAQSLSIIPIQLQQDVALIINGLSSSLIESSISSFIVEAKSSDCYDIETLSMWYAAVIITKIKDFFAKSYPMSLKQLESALVDKKSPAKCIQTIKLDLSEVPIPESSSSTKEMVKELKKLKSKKSSR